MKYKDVNLYLNMCSRYIAGTFAYGACRTAWYTWNRTTTDYDEKFNKTERPLLHTEIVGLSIANGLTSGLLFPLFLFEDVCNLERCARGIPLHNRSATILFWWH